jgi:hypothetical protein
LGFSTKVQKNFGYPENFETSRKFVISENFEIFGKSKKFG